MILERHLDKKGGIDNTTRFFYDKSGSLIEITDNQDRKTSIEYDLLNQEIRCIEKDGSITRQCYNKNGQLTKVIRPKEYHHLGEFGAGVQHHFTYDKVGNLLKDGKASYMYNAFQRNTKVETFDRNIQINHYDAEGLRQEMEENGKLVSFLFRGTEVVMEETQEENIRYIRKKELLASDAECARTIDNMIEIDRIHDAPLKLEMETLKQSYLDGVNFHRCLLNNLDFISSVLSNIDFRSAELNNSKFSFSVFDKSRLIMVDAKESVFDKCSFKETLLLHSDFSTSSFRFADLSEAIVNNVIFSQCDLRGANMSCAGLETCSLEGAIYDETTIWHKGFNLIGCGAIKE